MNLLIVDDESWAVQGILDGVNWERLNFSRVLTAGSYQEAVSFLLRTEQELPLVTLQSMKISADRSNPRKQVLSFVFEWPTFDPTPPRKPKGGRK